MENILSADFDPASALKCWTFSERLQKSEDQHFLDILEKERTSALPWRGQFSPQLIEYLLKKYSREGDYVIDPFCGSGTVLREAARANINALGMDVNPAAICLAKVSELLSLTSNERKKLVECLYDFVSKLKKTAEKNNIEEISIETAAEEILKFSHHPLKKITLEGYLLLLFSNGKAVSVKKISKSLDRYLSVAFGFHSPNITISAKTGDARSIEVEDNTFDYLITSPPYINVFNYHQNYRPIIEALGHTPLTAARSEMGANRKFRQNRYMTVIQYCMDMAQFLVEANRVLKERSKLTIVLGRESNVRSVSFKNSELISAIAFEGLGFELIEWNERKFMNRYGESIYEDVITMTPKEHSTERAVEIGRSVGAQALKNALEHCPDERKKEIEEAFASSKKISTSPLTGSV